jgi:hypothetical protein
MKNKPLYQKLIPKAITMVILASLVILAIDPAMRLVLYMTIAFNTWMAVLVIKEHYEEIGSSKQVTVYSHQELRRYAGGAILAYNATLRCYYNRECIDPKDHKDNDSTIIVGRYVWIKSPILPKRVKIKNDFVGDGNTVTNNINQM